MSMNQGASSAPESDETAWEVLATGAESTLWQPNPMLRKMAAIVNLLRFHTTDLAWCIRTTRTRLQRDHTCGRRTGQEPASGSKWTMDAVSSLTLQARTI